MQLNLNWQVIKKKLHNILSAINRRIFSFAAQVISEIEILYFLSTRFISLTLGHPRLHVLITLVTRDLYFPLPAH